MCGCNNKTANVGKKSSADFADIRIVDMEGTRTLRHSVNVQKPSAAGVWSKVEKRNSHSSSTRK